MGFNLSFKGEVMSEEGLMRRCTPVNWYDGLLIGAAYEYLASLGIKGGTRSLWQIDSEIVIISDDERKVYGQMTFLGPNNQEMKLKLTGTGYRQGEGGWLFTREEVEVVSTFP